jgi:dTDP-4-dehydrorhamnose reductase
VLRSPGFPPAGRTFLYAGENGFSNPAMQFEDSKMTVQKRFIVTGAQGFVAGSVLAQAGSECKIHALTRGAVGKPHDRLQWHAFESLNPGKLKELFDTVLPHAVIHTAALADIDYCQSHREEAQAVNVELTGVLAELCARSEARLILCSTDTVFDGEHAPYTEDSLPGPVNFYAETKVAAEQIVARLGSLGVVARLSLVMGLPIFGAGNSFLARMLAALKEGRSVAFPQHEIRTPVDVVTVGRALLELAAGTHHGSFHLAGLTRINRFEMAQQLAGRFGYPRDLVVAQNTSAVSGRAARPRDVSLETRRSASRLATPFLTLDEAISLVQRTSASLSL